MTQTETRRLALQLPPEERIELAVELWDSLGQDAPVADWQVELVRQRIRALDEREPEERSEAWEEVRARLWGSSA